MSLLRAKALISSVFISLKRLPLYQSKSKSMLKSTYTAFKICINIREKSVIFSQKLLKDLIIFEQFPDNLILISYKFHVKKRIFIMILIRALTFKTAQVIKFWRLYRFFLPFVTIVL